MLSSQEYSPPRNYHDLGISKEQIDEAWGPEIPGDVTEEASKLTVPPEHVRLLAARSEHIPAAPPPTFLRLREIVDPPHQRHS